MNNNIFNKFEEALIANGIIIPEENLSDYPELLVDRLDSIHEWGYITRQTYAVCDDMVHFYTHDNKLIASLWLEEYAYEVVGDMLHVKDWVGKKVLNKYNLCLGQPIEVEDCKVYSKKQYNTQDEYFYYDTIVVTNKGIYKQDCVELNGKSFEGAKLLNITIEDIEKDGFCIINNDAAVREISYVRDAIVCGKVIK